MFLAVPVTLTLTAAVPALFTADYSGKEQPAALNRDNTVIGPSNPVAVVLTIGDVTSNTATRAVQ